MPDLNTNRTVHKRYPMCSDAIDEADLRALAEAALSGNWEEFRSCDGKERFRALLQSIAVRGNTMPIAQHRQLLPNKQFCDIPK